MGSGKTVAENRSDLDESKSKIKAQNYLTSDLSYNFTLSLCRQS